ncbi:MAG: peptidoglycan-binding protein, partial [Eubacteriales bacterium]|nr:peptidoglycan-binding protein [Eubacteriales bacterium]
DCETINPDETAILLQIAGGTWNWDRRPIIVEIDGQRIAASLTARPHAGRDDKPAHSIVSYRSGGYGRGTNWDSIKGNAMDGHFDIHFYGSKTHVNNTKDPDHQAAVQVAFHSED